jgi:hypothetical protein
MEPAVHGVHQQAAGIEGAYRGGLGMTGEEIAPVVHQLGRHQELVATSAWMSSMKDKK